MKFITYLLCLASTFCLAQTELTGVVFDDTKSPLPDASVQWLGTKIGTITNFDGAFAIPYKSSYKKLVISYVGYKTDTILVQNPSPITHALSENASIDVMIEAEKKATVKSYRATANILKVNSDELLKAACCNLAESFETNPSIDVNFADAISGTRQIKMLGLTSPYLLIATENIPTIRGAAQTYGMSFTPGTWVESIQITKGAGSVVNGFESIAGQINAELVKPKKDAKLFVNGYGALNGRMELNTHFNTKLNDRWSTGLYLHGNLRNEKFDNNNDTFLDMPLAKQVNVMNRLQYTNGEKGLVSFINLRYLNDEKQTGQTFFNPSNDKLTTNAWGSEINTKRFDFSGKFAYVNPEIQHQTLALQLAFSNHDQDSYFGLNMYDIKHNSTFATLMYSSIIGDTRHKIKTGINFNYDDYNEFVNTVNVGRKENNVGAFAEYAFDDLEDFSLTAGLRIDNHNLLGTFITPRFHMRYAPWEKGVFRASFGRGKRAANIYTENQSIFATSRAINIASSGGEIYGLNPEIAWNYGVSFLQGFRLFDRKGDVTIDYYRTDFQNQVVVDYETPTQVSFYNLNGKSIANSLQVELGYSPFPHFNMRLAYKYYGVTTDYNSGSLEKPLTPKNRFFANLSYETHQDEGQESHWKFDATYNVLGEQRLPSTLASPVQYRQTDYTPSVATLNAQVTRVFSNKFEIYLGGENMTNTKQNSPIVSANNPFGAYFDTTFVYGPIFGSSYYAGFRYTLK